MFEPLTKCVQRLAGFRVPYIPPGVGTSMGSPVLFWKEDMVYLQAYLVAKTFQADRQPGKSLPGEKTRYAWEIFDNANGPQYVGMGIDFDPEKFFENAYVIWHTYVENRKALREQEKTPVEFRDKEVAVFKYRESSGNPLNRILGPSLSEIEAWFQGREKK